MIKAVIFDLDGTLIDALDGYVFAINKALKAKGFRERSADEMRKYYGQTFNEIIRQLTNKSSVDKDVIETVRLKGEFYKATKGAYIKILGGALDIIAALRDKKISMAIASSSGREIIEDALNKMGTADSISVIVSADDITHSKPNPEAFLKAAKKLKVPPNECLVFEDSLHGIAAAKTAGMKCIAVATGGTSKEELKKLNPDILVDNLMDILPQMDKILEQ